MSSQSEEPAAPSPTSQEQQEDQELPLELQLEQARKIQADFQHLVKSPGWARLVNELIEPQIRTRMNAARFSAWNSMDTIMFNASLMNEVNGLQLVPKMVEGVLEEQEETISQLLSLVREEEDDDVNT